LRTGVGPPGTAMNSTRNVSHPTWFEEKSGGETCCCAAISAVSATYTTAVKTPPTSTFALEANVDIVPSPLASFVPAQKTGFSIS